MRTFLQQSFTNSCSSFKSSCTSISNNLAEKEDTQKEDKKVSSLADRLLELRDTKGEDIEGIRFGLGWLAIWLTIGGLWLR